MGLDVNHKIFNSDSKLELKAKESRARRKIDTTIHVMTIEEIKQERISCYDFMIS